MRSNVNRTVYLPILFLVIFGFSPVGTSSTTSTINISQRDETTPNTEPLNCTTELSPDFYGFGVRLGVYFAWLSQYFANILLPSEIASSLDTNSIFLLALLASLFRGTLVHELFQIDGLILMHLSSGFLFSSLSIWGYRTSIYQKEGPTAINYFGRFVPGSIHLVFKQWPVTGGIHTFYIIISIGCAVYYGTMCIAAVLVVIFTLFQGGWKRKRMLQTGFTAFELSIVYNVLRIFNLLWIVFCASMIEMTLNFNHMLDTLAPYGRIGYPGQLVPLIVGILSLVRVLWLIYGEWKDSRPDGNARNAASTYQYIHDILWPPFNVDDMASGELETANMPSTLTPWHHRYLVAYLPWLSALSFWKTANGPYMLTTYQTVASS